MGRTTCQTDRVRPKMRVTTEADDVYGEIMEAIGALRREHDRLAESLMLTVDLLGDVQNGQRIHLQKLRSATARTGIDSLRKRERAIFQILGYEQLSDEELTRWIDQNATEGE
jgi:hypothetical protein